MSPAAAVPALEPARAALQQTFGFPDFLPHQAAILPRVLAGETLLVIWPTGGGKSLLYQLPALVERGPTLVVSPLISLMQDQWQALQARGVAADALHSHLPRGELERTLERLRYGRTRLLYLAPERLRDPRVLHALTSAPQPVARIAVDEAHCITEWGHDFREDYMAIPRARAALGEPPMLLLTATATPPVQDDIRTCMEVPGCPVVAGPLDRPNLFLGRRDVRSQQDKLAALDDLVPRLPTGTGLIYCATRGQTETVAVHLTQRGVRVAHYHAGLSGDERSSVQHEFLTDGLDCVAATNAFGMGIDKPDVRWVIHFAHPGSLEAYYQEIGRVGRDGLPSDCILLYSPHDAQVHRQFIRDACPPVDAVVRTFRRMVSRADGTAEVTLGRGEWEHVKHDLFLLEQVGAVEQEWRRGHRSRLHLRVQAGDVAAEAPTQRAHAVWGVLDAAFDLSHRGGAGPADLVGSAAADLEWSVTEVEQALYDLETSGLVAFRPADGSLVYRLLTRRLTEEQGYALGEALALRRRLRQGRLDAVRRFATSDGCHRAALLAHFGTPPPDTPCGYCSGCGTPR